MLTRSRGFRSGLAGLYSNLSDLSTKKTQWFSGQLLDLNPGKRVRCVPLEMSHPTYGRLRQAPLPPAGEIRTLLSCRGKERMDIRGVVLEDPTLSMRVAKAEVWLADTSAAAVLVELWGPSFLGLVRESVRCGAISDIQNASVEVSDKGLVSVTGEFFGDSDRGHTFARALPSSPETAALEEGAQWQRRS